ELLYAVQKPLLSHDRPAASIAREQLRERFANSHPAKLADLALARYDAHPVRLMQALEALLADFPHEATWVLAKATLLRELHRLPERQALLEAEGAALDAEPMLIQSLAQMLLPLHDRQDDA